MAGIYDAIDAVKDVIEAMDSAPDTVAIVPRGQEEMMLPKARNWWVTIHPVSDSETPEPGNAYLMDYTIGVTVWRKSQAKADTVVSTISADAANVRAALRYSTLGGWSRTQIIGDAFGPGEYIAGETVDNVYGYSFEITASKQYT